ncbi:hypothetical protein TCE0_029f07871 [Talaromyces pinophilus]|uniref:Uncharacterized protein n=1 Tax=Talaromyces pinophilus TaxID=128442 RepID=A0A0B8MYA5_TALPI|nr:hypothetical protein TCE0_029f07871 [Talaromyces pinophilus]
MAENKRRAQYKKACDYVAKNRKSAYNEIAFDHLIPLPFYLTVPQLSTIDHSSTIIERVFTKYTVNGDDLYDDWTRYCKSLTNEDDRAEAILGAVYFAKKTLLKSDRREKWASSVLNDFRSLQRSPDGPNANHSNNHVDESGVPSLDGKLQEATPDTLDPAEKSSPPLLESTEKQASRPDSRLGIIGDRKRTHTEDLDINLHTKIISPQNDDADTLNPTKKVRSLSDNTDKGLDPRPGQTDLTHTQTKQTDIPPTDELEILPIRAVSEQGIPVFLRPPHQPVESRLPLPQDQFLDFLAKNGYANAFEDVVNLRHASKISMICPWDGAPSVEIEYNIRVDITFSEQLVRWVRPQLANLK